MLGVHHLCTGDTSLAICFEFVFGHKIDAKVCAILVSHAIFVWTSGTGHSQFFLVTMPQKVAVVDEGAKNGPIQADRQMTCAQRKRAAETVQEET